MIRDEDMHSFSGTILEHKCHMLLFVETPGNEKHRPIQMHWSGHKNPSGFIIKMAHLKCTFFSKLPKSNLSQDTAFFDNIANTTVKLQVQ